MKIRNSERTAEELEPALEKAYFRCIAAADETDGKGER
jgi:hypothetical protein